MHCLRNAEPLPRARAFKAGGGKGDSHQSTMKKDKGLKLKHYMATLTATKTKQTLDQIKPI
jgi:hypothetical protein